MACLLALLAVVLSAATGTAAVTNYTWAPTPPGNARWSRAGNWALNNAPPGNLVSGLTNTDITFAGTVKTAPVLDMNYYVHALTFAPSAGAFTLTPQSSQTLFVGTGGISNNSSNIQSILTAVTVSGNQTWIANSGDLFFGGAVNLSGNDLTIAGNYDTTIQAIISGGGAMVKQGMGELVLGGTGANTFTGGMTVNSGTVTLAKADALGTGPLTLTGGVLDLGVYNVTASAISLLGGTVTSSSGGITSGSDYQFQSGTVAASLGGAVGLIKTTSGTVTLTAANTYTGGTQIRAGRLTVNNATGSGTGTGPVWIGSGGLLAGTGTVGGFVTNAPGGSISAGNEVGVLNLGSTVWFGGATDRWDISDAAGPAGVGWDVLNINGTLTLSATSLDKAIIDVTSFTLGGVRGLAANFDPAQNYLWTIVQTSGGIIFQPGEDASTVFDLVTGNFLNPLSGGRFGVELSADGLSLNVTFTTAIVVPEPDKVAMVGLGFCGLVYGRRFKQNWTAPRRK